jgi:hypothetical protein
MSRVYGEVPMKSSGIFPKSIICVASYLLGIVTVAVLCCDDWRQVADAINLPASASEMDGGEEQLPVARLAFVFPKGIDGIAGVTASVYTDDAEYPLDVRLYRAEGLLVVETQANLGQVFIPHFYFLDSNGEKVKEYLAQLVPDQSLITYPGQDFSGDLQYPRHYQPAEIQLNAGENTDVSLETENRIWVGDRFVNLWQVVSLSSGSAQASSPDCTLIDLGQGQPSLVGISSDGKSGDVISLEVLP